MKAKFLSIAAAAALALTAIGTVNAETVGGVEGGSTEALVPGGGLLSELASALSSENIKRYQGITARIADGGFTAAANVNFNTVAAPCHFIDTAPLRGAFQGAFFAAPGLDGGATLDECSNFGVNALSPPNFLAFNNAASYTTGGVAKLPEIIAIPGGAIRVSMALSGGNMAGATMAIVAVGPGGVQDVQVLVTSAGFVTHTVTGTHISRLLLVGNPPSLVVDNILSN